MAPPANVKVAVFLFFDIYRYRLLCLLYCAPYLLSPHIYQVADFHCPHRTCEDAGLSPLAADEDSSTPPAGPKLLEGRVGESFSPEREGYWEAQESGAGAGCGNPYAGAVLVLPEEGGEGGGNRKVGEGSVGSGIHVGGIWVVIVTWRARRSVGFGFGFVGFGYCCKRGKFRFVDACLRDIWAGGNRNVGLGSRCSVGSGIRIGWSLYVIIVEHETRQGMC